MARLEDKLRSEIVRLLAPLLAFPVENSVGTPGVPDICCVAGWIEMKIAKQPRLTSTIVDIEVRPAQRIWMRNWCKAGGPGWYLTKMGTLWMLHEGGWGSENLGRVTQNSLIHRSNLVRHESGLPDADSLIRALMFSNTATIKGNYR